MRAALYALIAAAAVYFTAGGAAQAGVEVFDGREAFASASRALSTIDFNSAAPARGFGMYRAEEGLTAGGATFRARGGARFGPGRIYVLSAHYGAGNPMLNTGTLPLLSWSAPNQPPVTNQPPPADTAPAPAQASTPQAPTPQGSSAAPARGTIAYVRGGTEIRLVEADGTGDRRLWTHPFAKEGSAIHDLAWRPDGKELAFSSSHMNVASLYHADLYAVGPDGSGFLYTFPDYAYEFGNVFRYDFATRSATQLTKFEGEYARAFDVSPDGAWVVFERAKKLDDDKDVDLWLMRSDGSDARLLVRGGLAPSWR